MPAPCFLPGILSFRPRSRGVDPGSWTSHRRPRPLTVSSRRPCAHGGRFFASLEGEHSLWVPDEAEVAELRRRVEKLRKRVRENVSGIDTDFQERVVRELELEASAPGFWERAGEAQGVMEKLAYHKGVLERVARWQEAVEDAEAVLELLGGGEMVGVGEMIREVLGVMERTDRDVEGWELQMLLGSEYDRKGAIVTVMAGAGGTDAMDWAEMMLRMYARWGEKKGFRVQVVEESLGDEAGLKSGTVTIDGEFAYGLLSGEKGAHRLVRISPFNALGKRQTSFAGVEVMPLLGETELVDIDIPSAELAISTMRSSGAGGQNVNKLETAVRVLHKPTGITVRCSRERSQSQNKETAMRILKAKLLIVAREQRVKDLAEIRGDKIEPAWGNQIRNYVLHPYKMVKDLRTAQETANTQAVLDGDIDAFISAFLVKNAEINAAKEPGKPTSNVA